MAGKANLWIQILEHCRDDSRSITPLVGVAAPRSTLYRCKDELLRTGLLEADGKDRYKTSAQGLLRLEEVKGEAPKGLSVFYPPLLRVPTPQHRALIELAIAAVIARKYGLRADRHPTIIIAGPTLSWKTSTGIFLCHMLGLNLSTQIVNLAAESGRSLWLRKTSTGRVAYKRELLETPLVIFDEYQEADSESKRLLGIWMDGRKNVALENEQLTIEAVPLLTLNPCQGRTLEERLGISRAQLRRSITCDLTRIKLPNLAIKGEDIIKAAKAQGALNLPQPQHDCTSYKPKLYDLFTSTLNQEGQELVDLETLAMLSSAMTAYLEPVEAIRLVFYDCLLLFETLGWTQPSWTLHVKSFPTAIATNASAIKSLDTETIPKETWIAAFKHLDEGAASSELVTKLHLTVEVAERIAKKYSEIRSLDEKKPSGARTSYDSYLQRLEHDLKEAELKRRIAEQQRPLEVDRELADLNAILDESGRWKREHCAYMHGNYCMIWLWNEKPTVRYQIGEPLQRDGKWCIRPAYCRCATCPVFHQVGTTDQRSLELKFDNMSKTLAGTPMLDIRERFQCSICGSKGLVAAKIKCTKCGEETWWGWHPPSSTA